MIGLLMRGDAVDRVGEEIRLEHLHVGARLHLLDVGAGGKGALRSGEHDAAHRVVAVPGLQRVDQFVEQRGVERVQRLGPVERDDADRAFHFRQDIFVIHSNSSLPTPCSSRAGPANAIGQFHWLVGCSTGTQSRCPAATQSDICS